MYIFIFSLLSHAWNCHISNCLFHSQRSLLKKEIKVVLTDGMTYLYVFAPLFHKIFCRIHLHGVVLSCLKDYGSLYSKDKSNVRIIHETPATSCLFYLVNTKLFPGGH